MLNAGNELTTCGKADVMQQLGQIGAGCSKFGRYCVECRTFQTGSCDVSSLTKMLSCKNLVNDVTRIFLKKVQIQLSTGRQEQ